MAAAIVLGTIPVRGAGSSPVIGTLAYASKFMALYPNAEETSSNLVNVSAQTRLELPYYL